MNNAEITVHKLATLLIDSKEN